MKIQGLDGKEYSWIPSNNIVETEKRSGLHNKARQLLKEKYPELYIKADVDTETPLKE